MTLLACWHASKAMQHARDQVRELTERRRLLPVEVIVQDVNAFLLGWVAYFRNKTLFEPTAASLSDESNLLDGWVCL